MSDTGSRRDLNNAHVSQITDEHARNEDNSSWLSVSRKWEDAKTGQSENSTGRPVGLVAGFGA